MSYNRNTLLRSMHDLGLAAWFGGSLMGATGLNGAASDVDDPTQRARVANAGWSRWTPWNAVAIGAHLVGAVGMVNANKSRIAHQKGVAGMSTFKTGLTVAALAATGYSRLLGQKVISAGDVPVAGGTSPLPTTPPEVAQAQKQLKALQWAIPALTGGLLATSAYAGEQMKATEQARGIPLGMLRNAGALAAGAGAAVAGTAHGAVDKVRDIV